MNKITKRVCSSGLATAFMMSTAVVFAGGAPAASDLLSGLSFGVGVGHTMFNHEMKLIGDDGSADLEDHMGNESISWSGVIDYGRYFNDAWYLGAQLNYRYLPKAASGPSEDDYNPSQTYSLGSGVDMKNIWGLNAKFGYKLDSGPLYYALAGYTQAHFEGSLLEDDDGDMIKADSTQGGWLYGVGANFPLTPQWYLGLQYERASYSSFISRDNQEGDYIDLKPIYSNFMMVVSYSF